MYALPLTPFSTPLMRGCVNGGRTIRQTPISGRLVALTGGEKANSGRAFIWSLPLWPARPDQQGRWRRHRSVVGPREVVEIKINRGLSPIVLKFAPILGAATKRAELLRVPPLRLSGARRGSHPRRADRALAVTASSRRARHHRRPRSSCYAAHTHPRRLRSYPPSPTR